MEEYYRRIAELAKKHLDVKEVKIFVLKKTFCSLRLQMKENVFIDVYYSTVSERKDLFLVANGKRVFGYDNLGGWHRHPIKNPDSHEACIEPAEEAVFAEMKGIVENL
mgnify:CR=1 FL=1